MEAGDRMRIQRRISRLEVVVQPAAPSWGEVYAAEQRSRYRGARKLRTFLEINCTGAEFTEETGPPYLWRASNLANEASLLDSDSEEQKGKDNETLDRWHKVKGTKMVGVGDGGGGGGGTAAAREKLTNALEKLVASLSWADETEASDP